MNSLVEVESLAIILLLVVLVVAVVVNRLSIPNELLIWRVEMLVTSGAELAIVRPDDDIRPAEYEDPRNPARLRALLARIGSPTKQSDS